MQATINFIPAASATLAEVLQVFGTTKARVIKPLSLTVEAPLRAVLQKAADEARAIMVRGARHNASIHGLEATHAVQFYVEDQLDDTTAAVASTIFDMAGWYTQGLKVCYPSALRELEAFVLGRSKAIRFLLAEQQDFAFV